MSTKLSIVAWVLALGLASLFVSDASLAAPPLAVAAKDGRCAPAQDPRAEQAFGVVEICHRIDATIKKDPLEWFTDIIVGAATLGGVVPPGVQVWDPVSRRIKYQVPNKPEFAKYSICRLTTHVYSEIPGQGRYLRAGWLRPDSDRSADFRLFLKRRGGTQGRTSYHADAYFSFLPTDRLGEARQSKVCMTAAELAAIPVAR